MELVKRTLNALTELSKYPRGLSVGELSQILQLPVSSTHRILASLKESNFVYQNPENKQYCLSYKVLTLASNLRSRDLLIQQARPEMVKLAKKICKTTILCVRDGDCVLNLDCVENEDASIYMVKTGIEQPNYETSAGRVFLAYESEEQQEADLRKANITVHTPKTITDKTRLKHELHKIRQDGYALMDEELQLNVQGVASPIFDANGQVIAAVAFTTIKVSRPVHQQEVQELLNCARAISERMQ